MKRIILIFVALIIVFSSFTYADTISDYTPTQITSTVPLNTISEVTVFNEIHLASNAIRTALEHGNVTKQQLQLLLFSLITLEEDLNDGRVADSVGLLDALTNVTVLTEQLEVVKDTYVSGVITDVTLKAGSIVNQAINLRLTTLENGSLTATYRGVKVSAASLRPKYALGATTKVLSTNANLPQGDFSNFKKVTNYTTQTFNDFKITDWYAPFVQYAYETGIITGKGAGKFDPNGNLTVAEAIALASKVNKVYYGEIPVFEAGGANWYDNIVKYAVDQGMITSSEFSGRYNQQATRAQMVYIFSKALPSATFKAINTKFVIPDVTSRTTYSDKIQMFYDAGIIAGSDAAGNFKPTANISRAEAATIINKVANPNVRTVRATPVVAPVVTTAKVPWTVGTVKVQVSVDLNGKAVYRDKEQGAVLIKKGTLVASGVYAKEDYYSMSTHTYGAATQEEYNQVIQIMQRAYAKIEFKNIKDVPGYQNILVPYMNGTLSVDLLTQMERSYTTNQLNLLKKGKVDDFIQTTYVSMMRVELSSVRQELLHTNATLSTETAFGYISSNLQTDCNGSAQADLALLDFLGFTDSFIVLNQTHAWAVSYYAGIFGDTQYLTTHFGFRAAHGIVVKPTKTTHGIPAGDYYNKLYTLPN